MSHSFNKSDGTFPHKKNGGVLGKQHPAGYNKEKALSKAKHVGLGKSHERWTEALAEVKNAPRTKGKKLDGGHTFKFK